MLLHCFITSLYCTVMLLPYTLHTLRRLLNNSHLQNKNLAPPLAHRPFSNRVKNFPAKKQANPRQKTRNLHLVKNNAVQGFNSLSPSFFHQTALFFHENSIIFHLFFSKNTKKQENKTGLSSW